MSIPTENKCTGYLVEGETEYRPCEIALTKPRLKEYEGKKFCFFHYPQKWEDNENLAYTHIRSQVTDAINHTKKTINLKGAIFKEPVDFRGILQSSSNNPVKEFQEITIDLSYTIFKDQVTLWGHTNYECTGSIFQAESIFEIDQNINLSSACFAENSICKLFPKSGNSRVIVRNAIFKESSKLDSRRLKGEIIDFTDSLFLSPVELVSPHSQTDILFDNVSFKNKFSLEIDGPKYKKLSFKNAIFGKKNKNTEVSFQNCHFQGETDFSQAVFYSCPKFFHTKFHEHTDFSGAKFLDTKSPYAESAYSALKHRMEERKNRSEEIRFHALELKSKLHKSKWYTPECWMLKLYQLFSNFGQSIGQPLLVLLLVFLAFLGIYSYVFCITNAVEFTSYLTFKPFSLFSMKEQHTLLKSFAAQETKKLPLLITSAIHSILNLSILTLLILAVRRRYKME